MFSSQNSQVSSAANYIEDVFSTYLYTGNGSTQTITNGIDLSTKGGLVWMKNRNLVRNHNLYDTARGAYKQLRSDSTGAQITNASGYGLTAFNADGFSLGTDIDGENYGNVVSWTFRKQPKFFDVVTYTGNGTSGRAIAHSLGSTPGCVIVKCTTNTYDWMVYHRSLPSSSYFLKLNTTAAQANVSSIWSTTAPTATDFYVGSDGSTNGSGETYVAYIFAHDAGGFGLSGSDNVISCGSYTGNGSSTGPEVNIGYEPQWLLIKEATQSGNSWSLYDNMRGLSVAGPSGHLRPNDSAAEDTTTIDMRPTATGFQPISSSGRVNRSGETFIYIAIRRGPMKVPTSGTSVFTPSTVGASNNITVGFPADTAWFRYTGSDNWRCFDRLRSGFELATNLTDAEGTYNYYPTYIDWDSNSVWYQNLQNGPVVDYFFRRAPSFFDVVCYTGTGSATTFSHNLGVAPELMIVKRRNAVANWPVYTASTATNEYLFLNSGGLPTTATTVWNNTAPTSSVFSVGTSALTNASAGTYVAYLFSSCAGVSKVGSYTGTGALQTINCGFTSGARFVLIKLISSGTSGSGDWYVWDSARGISSGNDPYLLINSDTAETTGTNYVDTDSTGFKVTAAGATDINASGDVYLFLAIA